MNARQNRGDGRVFDIGRYRDSDVAQGYKAWHWGDPPKILVEWPDPDYPDEMIECGRLVELRYRPPRQRHSAKISLVDSEANKSHLAFDPRHPYQRLYCCCSAAVRNDMKVRFWKDGAGAWNLNDLAEAVGGRHGTRDYVDTKVVPIGALTHVIYATHKVGDDPTNFYVHKLGEESGLLPALAVDSRGRPWIVGSNYTAPTPGITD